MRHQDEWEIAGKAIYEAAGEGCRFTFRAALERTVKLPFKVARDAPYKFPAKNMHDVCAYLMNRDSSRGGTSHFFSWNVKAHGADYTGHGGPEAVRCALDASWGNYLDKHQEIVGDAFDAAARTINDDEWTAYPGTGQGEWEFFFTGRSNGWIVLDKWRNRRTGNRDDVLQWLMECLAAKQDALVTEFYVGIVTADTDFTQEKAAAEVSYHLNFARSEWESSRAMATDGLTHALTKATEKWLREYGYDAEGILAQKSTGNNLADAAGAIAQTAIRLDGLSREAELAIRERVSGASAD